MFWFLVRVLDQEAPERSDLLGVPRAKAGSYLLALCFSGGAVALFIRLILLRQVGQNTLEKHAKT
ncbi:MAG: hypothetical protein A2710_26465 [Burkholderiales bacterium RIFCSPHIGHO2_01_FULL_64_960]|nr:MAG: hypothetical protein A2710_26465 [Burkholderiales bacterium RIFCSPHIGHO2_01_FULL_64_960]